jgi:hypothetical protein
MEEIIYFLLIIGWLVYSFYQQNEKKKRRQAELEAAKAQQKQRRQQGEMEEVDDGEKQSDSTFKRIFEELLMDEDEGGLEYEAIEEEINPRAQQEAKRNKYQEFMDTKVPDDQQGSLSIKSPDALAKKIAALEKEMVLQEGEDELTEKQQFKDFDLRKAVIYSEILNRKY